MNNVAVRRRPVSSRHDRRDVVINLRATESWRSLIDHAASLSQKTRTDFIIEATRQKAENVLLDQKFFELNTKQYNGFIQIFDNPPPPNDALIKLLNRRPPWQKP